MNKTSNTVTVTANLTSAQLRQAADLADEITAKQNLLTALLSGQTVNTNDTTVTVGGKRQLSPEAKAAIAQGQKNRWAKRNAAASVPVPTGGVTPATSAPSVAPVEPVVVS